MFYYKVCKNEIDNTFQSNYKQVATCSHQSNLKKVKIDEAKVGGWEWDILKFQLKIQLIQKINKIISELFR